MLKKVSGEMLRKGYQPDEELTDKSPPGYIEE
jgi:hypothetical protein